MKILKPGKVELRKFVCPRCGCVFVASTSDITWHQCDYNKDAVDCPCGRVVAWDKGEPYEEHAETVDSDRKWAERLIFEELSGKRGHSPLLTDHLLQNSVTFKEE